MQYRDRRTAHPSLSLRDHVSSRSPSKRSQTHCSIFAVTVNEHHPRRNRCRGRTKARAVVFPKRDPGRPNASECDIAFENDRYPMVSRKHAEFRWQDGKWYVVDLGSSYGTYVQGRQITQPLSISAGASIQFGTDGPVMTVVWFEAPFEQSEINFGA